MLRSMASGFDISQIWARTSGREISVRFIAYDMATLQHRSVPSTGIVS